ncbi:MAG: NrdJb [Granulosicoccus sp.]|nr:NrdJb [Granulosicoccus sp.]
MKIDKKIVGFTVNKSTDSDASPAVPASVSASDLPKKEGTLADVIQMHETLARPHKLVGSTYKLKTPDHVSAHAMYITINDIVLNEGTEHELRRPFEVFINSKNLEHYQWIVALTLIMSAVFRKGGDITFLVDELRSVFDPRGGYWNKGKYVPSIIAEIGDVIERHLIDIGMLKKPEPDPSQAKLIEEKKAALRSESSADTDTASQTATDADSTNADSSGSDEEPWAAQATHCGKCHNKSVVVRDGCQTCLNCGDSKCG